jgi:hypothetical protein
MEDAVDRQEQDHFHFVQAEATRLALSRFNGNDDIAEEIRMGTRELKLSGLRPGLPGKVISFHIVPLDPAHKAGLAGHVPVTFPHRKGNDIGGFIPSEMALIQFLDLGVIDE